MRSDRLGFFAMRLSVAIECSIIWGCRIPTFAWTLPAGQWITSLVIPFRPDFCQINYLWSSLIFYGLKGAHDHTDRLLGYNINQVHSYMTTFKHKKGCRINYFRNFSQFLPNFCQQNGLCRSFTALRVHINTLTHC